MNESSESSGGLLKSALIALIAAIVVAVLFVLPAEYGVDPTGVGAKLGLVDLAETVEQPAEAPPKIVAGAFPEIPTDFDYYEPEVLKDPFSRLHDAEFRSDTLTIDIGVVEEVEYKLKMKQGDAVVYSWRTGLSGLPVRSNRNLLVFRETRPLRFSAAPPPAVLPFQQGRPDRAWHRHLLDRHRIPLAKQITQRRQSLRSMQSGHFSAARHSIQKIHS